LVTGLDVGRLEGVDRTGRPVRGVGGVDLDLVALVHRGPGVVGGREAHEDPGVVVAPHLPVQLQGVRRQFLGVVPEQAHAAVGLQRAVLDVEAAGAGLLPAVQGVAVEDRPVALGRLAVGLDLAGGVLESAEQVGAEGFLGVGLLGVAAAGVEGAAAAVVLAPGDRVVALHGAALVGRLVQGGEDLGLLTRVGAVVVPLVGALPGVVQVGGGRVVVVLDAHGGLLD